MEKQYPIWRILQNEKFLQDMENGGYRILDTVDLYYIFVCEQYR